MRARSLLRRRSFAELRERAGQELAKRSERLRWRDAAEPSDRDLAGWLGPSMPNVAAWRQHFATRPARFFRGFANPAETAQAIRRVDPVYAERAVARAQAVLGGRFDLLGYRGLECGWPINWHRDPVLGVQAPIRHWSAIPYLDPRIAGDHKVIWELNRQQWLVDMGAAWWLSGDERFARGMVDVLTQWMERNPPKQGMNWASSLEISFRAMSWIWALEFLRGSSTLDAQTLARLTKFLVLHGRHLETYLSTYFSPNTHLTGEALGLFYLGAYFPELPQAARWKETGAAILLEQLPRHVLRDGVYFEQSVHYHRYTIDFYTHLWLLDEATGGTLAVEIAPQLDALLEHVQCLTRGDGSVPLVGDEDGGRLFFLDARPLNDLRGALAVGAVLFERPDFAFVADTPSADLVWLLGPTAVDQFAGMNQQAPRYASRGFDDGGVYVMRDGWERDSNHMVIDCGPHGSMNCGHAHADALAFELALRGRPVFVDPGTYTYTVSPQERDAFRSTLAHNAASVDGAGSSEPEGPFHWARIANARVLAWRPTNDGRTAVFEGSHDGFEHLPSPVRYRRAVEFNAQPDRLLVMRDVFESRANHTALLTFQCAPGIQVVQHDANVLELARDGEYVCTLEVFGERGAFEITDGWVSQSYGVRESASRCRFVAPLTLGSTVLTTTVRTTRQAALQASPASALMESR